MFKALYPNLIPEKQTQYSAGFDIRSRAKVVVPPRSIETVKTGVFIANDSEDWYALKDNHFILMTLRSSLAKKGLTMANGVGIIDMDYGDEIQVMLYNTTTDYVTIQRHERIAQLIVIEHLPYLQGVYHKESERVGGFGSTGRIA